MEQIEIEFKILVSKELYQQIIKDYHNQITKQYIQVNHYLMHPKLNELKYMVRVREKEGSYELTLKRPNSIGRKEMNIDIDEDIYQKIINHELVNNEIFSILKDQNITTKELDATHYLKTTRTDIKLKEGMLSIDKNEYEGKVDYEIEFEVNNFEIGKKKFLEIIKPYQLNYQNNCNSKVKRMLDIIKQQSLK